MAKIMYSLVVGCSEVVSGTDAGVLSLFVSLASVTVEELKLRQLSKRDSFYIKNTSTTTYDTVLVLTVAIAEGDPWNVLCYVSILS